MPPPVPLIEWYVATASWLSAPHPILESFGSTGFLQGQGHDQGRITRPLCVALGSSLTLAPKEVALGALHFTRMKPHV